MVFQEIFITGFPSTHPVGGPATFRAGRRVQPQPAWPRPTAADLVRLLPWRVSCGTHLWLALANLGWGKTMEKPETDWLIGEWIIICPYLSYSFSHTINGNFGPSLIDLIGKYWKTVDTLIHHGNLVFLKMSFLLETILNMGEKWATCGLHFGLSFPAFSTGSGCR